VGGADGLGTGRPTRPSANLKTWQRSMWMLYQTDRTIDLKRFWMRVSRGLENDPRCSKVVEDSAETAYGPCNLPGYGRSALHEEG